MNFTDFIIGALLMNAMPHLVIALSLYGYNYGLTSILENGYLIGALTVLVLFFIFGQFIVNFYAKK